MSRGIYTWHPRLNPHHFYTEVLPSDPRIMIAMHINWQKPTGPETLFHTPEPDNFNRAIMAKRAIMCDFIEDNVFYRDLLRDKWWSFYHVPINQLPAFDAWIKQQHYDLLWQHKKAAAVRQRRTLLWNKQSAPDLNLNERLYAMGYFDNLERKYFSEDNAMLTTRLGSLRSEAKEIMQNISQQV